MEIKEAMRLLNRAKSLLRHAQYNSREFDEHRKYLISSIEDFEDRNDQNHIADAGKMVSLRDQFAMAALPLVMTAEGIDATICATMSYIMADLMLKERKKWNLKH